MSVEGDGKVELISPQGRESNYVDELQIMGGEPM
jgi:hypothetical protein